MEVKEVLFVKERQKLPLPHNFDIHPITDKKIQK